MPRWGVGVLSAVLVVFAAAALISAHLLQSKKPFRDVVYTPAVLGTSRVYQPKDGNAAGSNRSFRALQQQNPLEPNLYVAAR
jgi:hypothetical protein